MHEVILLFQVPLPDLETVKEFFFCMNALQTVKCQRIYSRNNSSLSKSNFYNIFQNLFLQTFPSFFLFLFLSISLSVLSLFLFLPLFFITLFLSLFLSLLLYLSLSFPFLSLSFYLSKYLSRYLSLGSILQLCNIDKQENYWFCKIIVAISLGGGSHDLIAPPTSHINDIL